MSTGLKYSGGSFIVNNNGRLDYVTGSNKLRKEAYKMLITDRVGLFGTEIRKLIGQKLRQNSFQLNVKKYLKDAIVNYVQIQQQNQQLDTSETVVDASMNVWQDPDVPTNVNYKVTLMLQSGDVIDDIPVQSIKVGY